MNYSIKKTAGGTIIYYLNGKCHREDGPAIEFPSGSKKWFLNGKLHRINGPACEYCDQQGNITHQEYWLNGKLITKKELQLINALKPFAELLEDPQNYHTTILKLGGIITDIINAQEILKEYENNN